MDYEKKYKNALEWARQVINGETGFIRKEVEEVFPELQESADDKIREEIISALKWANHKGVYDKHIAWLEKQGKEESIDKVEPKFKVGDWITDGEAVFYVTSYDIDYGYQLETQKGTLFHFSDEKVENKYHLWSIQDAKDGDVLACNEEILLFKSYSVQNRISVYCWYNGQTDNFHSIEVTDASLTTRNKIYPAKKEQRDLLFQKMKEAGYEWDAEKKELKKIEQSIDIPFGAKDSEFQEVSYYIQEGFHAEIDGNKVVIKKGEQKSAWSEEDERMRQYIVNDLKFIKELVNDPHHVVPVKRVEKEIDWMESLKERYAWKPSDEQMRALHDMNLTGNISYARQGQTLIELYNDLKKLKEE